MAAIRTHIRSNVIGYVALFFSLSLGTAWALETNSVRSKHIVNGQVKAKDTRANQVQARVDGTCDPGQSIRLIAQDGSVSCVAGGGGGSPTGAAGGDLAGSYPNPLVGTNAVGSPEVIDNSLTANDLGAGSVGSSEIANNNVNAAKLGDVVTRSSNYSVQTNLYYPNGFDASCLPGEELIGGGGGWEDQPAAANLYSSQRVGVSQTWRVEAFQYTGSDKALQVDAICLL